jgi:dienelactone hydrolase
VDFNRDFHRFRFQHEHIEHDVWVGGSGPPVILMHELDGFGDAFIGLTERLAKEFRIYAPLFFGRIRQSMGAGLVSGLWHICIRREFAAFAAGKTSPVAGWIRKLAQHAQQDSTDRGRVGIIGMCLTGGIVLATVADPAVGAGVAAQPSLPLTFGFLNTPARRKDLGVAPADIEETLRSNTPILTLRFGNDPICPADRIAAITERLPSAQAPPGFLDGLREHCTLTARYRSSVPESVKEKSNQAITETIAFLHKYLR